MALSIGTTYGPRDISMPGDAIVLRVGDSYQAKIDAAPTGATFLFEKGIHRLTESLDPKDNQSFLGAEGAVLSGSHAIGSVQREGDLFVASGQTQEGLRRATDEAADGSIRAGYPETVFLDDKPLKVVESKADVEPGTFFFDYAADKIYLADDPSMHKIEAGVAPAAFHSDAVGVTVGNLIIEKFNSPVQFGAVQGGEEWTVTNNEVRLNYGVGITVQGGSTIRGNDIHDNGEMGIGGNGDNIVVEANEIHANGFWSGIDPTWEGGGSKFAETNNLIVRDNYSHDNHGLGLWTDIDNINTLYEGNWVIDNDGGGISHEISYDAVIRDNVVMGNGAALGGNWLWGAQIQIQNSSNVDVYGNKIDMSGGLNGIGLIQQDRGSGAYGEYATIGNHVHDNMIVSSSGDGQSGGVADHDEAGMLNGGNVFNDNRYYMADGDHWLWGDFESGDDFAAYLRDSDQGDGSTLSSLAPDTRGWIGTSAQEPAEPTPVTEPDPSEPSTPSPTPVTPAQPVARPGVGDVSGTARPDDIDGTRGDDTIFGLGGNDFIEGKAGDDLLYGGAGADTFFFDADAGLDMIGDFTLSGHSSDRIALPDNYFDSVNEVLSAAEAVGADTVIVYGPNELTIIGVTPDELLLNDFLIV